MIHELRPVRGARAEIEVKHSRFIALLGRTPDEASARAFVDAVRGEFHDARHHCSAFIVSSPGQHDLEHSSDDGEPSGTAGRPMLEVLRGRGLGQVTVVVVRYFGGVLLGTGGLVRAYSDAVRAVLDELELARVEQLQAVSVLLEHSCAGADESALQGAGLVPTARCYEADGVRLEFAVADLDEAEARIAALTQGRAHIERLGPTEAEVPLGGAGESPPVPSRGRRMTG